MKRYAYAVTGALALALSACGAGDDAELEITQVTEEEGQAGLEALGFAEQGLFTWDSRTFEDGVYTFSGVDIAADPDMAVSIATITLAAPRVEDGAPTFDRLTLETLAISDDEGALSLGAFVIEQPGPQLVELIAAMASGAPEPPQGDPMSPGFLDGFSYGRIALEDASLTIQETGESVSVGFEEISLNDFDGERLGAIILANLSVAGVTPDTGAPISLEMEEFRFDGLNLETGFSMARAIMAGSAAGFDFNLADPSAFYDGFAIRGLDADIAGVEIDMDAMVAEVDVRGEEVSSSFEMGSLTIAPGSGGPLGAQLGMGLGMLGYQNVELSAQSRVIYDRDEDRMYTQGDNYIEWADAVRISFDQDISGLAEYSQRYAAFMATLMEGGGEPDPAAMLELYEPIVIREYAITLTDDSLLEKGLRIAAGIQGVTPDQLRQQAAGMVAMALASAPTDLPASFTAEVSEALTTFINEGGSLTVAIRPQEPVSLGEIANQAMASGNVDVEALGLSVTAD